MKNNVISIALVATVLGALTGCASTQTQTSKIKLDMEVTETIPEELAMGYLKKLGRINWQPEMGQNCFFSKDGIAVKSNGFLDGTGGYVPYKKWRINFIGKSDTNVLSDRYSLVFVGINSPENVFCSPYIVESTQGQTITTQQKEMLEKTVAALTSLGVQYDPDNLGK